MIVAYWLNTAWMWKCRRELGAFQRAAASVAESQAARLGEIIAPNRATEFGRAHDFSAIDSVESFQRRVPLANHDSFRDAIERIGAGAPALLTAQPVCLLEPTSGSMGGEKLIPYNAALRGEFQRGIAAWLGDLLRAYPAVRRGRAYWSISPALGVGRKTSGGIPIGFDDDSAYLGGLERFALDRLLAAPADLARMADVNNFRYCTLLHLLAAKDLALISIWSPTFLTTLLDQLDAWGERIVRDLRDGSLTLPNPLGDSVNVQNSRRTQRQRAIELDGILLSSLPLGEKFRRIWPQLPLISCWADASSRRYVGALRELFPDVHFQPKGLLATEAFVSFPLVGRAGAALALRSHFFEFIEQDGARIHLAHQLELGVRYEVVVTTGGGLYRYRLGDIVEVVGYENHCPLLRFIGRTGNVSDLVGEKLHEAHVQKVVDEAFAAYGLTPRFALMAPVDNGRRGYCLYLQGLDRALSRQSIDALADTIESGLASNPYYGQAVRLGQLSKLQVELLAPDGATGWSIYERECLARGQKLGDIKPALLHDWPGWHERLTPLAIDRNSLESQRL
jgi:hypothetical protein